MAKASKALSRAVATRKARLPIIPISARARAVLAGSHEMFERRIARNKTLTDETRKAQRAVIDAQNAREAAEQAAREEEFLVSLWPSTVRKADREWQPPKPAKSLKDLGELAVAAYIDVSARNHLVTALLALSTAADVLEKATGR
jgi:hypothetical protein